MSTTTTEPLIGPLVYHVVPGGTRAYYTLCGISLPSETVLRLRVEPRTWVQVRFVFSGDADDFPLFQLLLPDVASLAVMRVPEGAMFRWPQASASSEVA